MSIALTEVLTEATLGRVDVRSLSVDVGLSSERLTALDRLDFTLEPGEFVCVLGPSGCGK
jgi:sulfonate transport system ATP-binding protein